MMNVEVETEFERPFGGVYSTGEVALYIKATMPDLLAFPGLNARHIARWASAGLGGEDSKRYFDRRFFVNFMALVSFRLVAAMRAQGISGKAIRLAHTKLQEKKGWPHPFAMAPVWERTPDLFADIKGIPAAVTHFNPFGEGCHGLTFDADGQAITWSPAPDVLLNPRIRGGIPCAEGSRVDTATFWGGHLRGESLQYQAESYSRTVPQVKAAIAWESKIAEFY